MIPVPDEEVDCVTSRQASAIKLFLTDESEHLSSYGVFSIDPFVIAAVPDPGREAIVNATREPEFCAGNVFIPISSDFIVSQKVPGFLKFNFISKEHYVSCFWISEAQAIIFVVVIVTACHTDL